MRPRPGGGHRTTDIDEIVALAPDCVLYMPRALDAGEVCRLLSAGINVVTRRGEFHHPASMDPGLRDRVAAACTEGAAHPGIRPTVDLPQIVASLG